jgi:hypothetical protein
MKKTLFITAFVCTIFAGCDTARQVLEGVNTAYGNGAGTGALSNADIVAGLRQALTVGTQNSTNQLSSLDGFFKNAAIKILMPEEAKKVESTLRSVGMGSMVDKAVLSMNRAAEDAAKGAGTIFINAIKQMTITDAVTIFKRWRFCRY